MRWNTRIARVRPVAVLEQKNPLPGAEHHLAVENGTLNELAVSMLRIWAGMSSAPSALCT